MEQAYFLTVDWCNQGKRGIFCNFDGQCFRKDEAHTEDEMFDILGAFDLVLAPKSELYTIEQVKKFTRWVPLAEYSNQFGIALECNPSNNTCTQTGGTVAPAESI